ncbi:MAG: polyphosphate kinase 1 [Oscillospiraceae bacterium]|nr:polyphosphate kinase 1 [Oscillospiraceae bacterium]
MDADTREAGLTAAPEETPTDTPEATPEITPEETPEETTEETPEETTEEITEEAPEETTTEAPAEAAEEAESAPSQPDDRICFMDRELSWLQFDLRVLMEAGDQTVPLMERLKFLSIYRSNMEEFFMVRVGTLTHRALLLPEERDEKTGWNAAEQLRHILAEVSRQQEIENQIYRRLLQDMAAAGVRVLDLRKINKVEEVAARRFFDEFRPLLSPQVVDGGHPFPFVGNNEVWVAAALAKKGGKEDDFKLGLVSLHRLPPYRVWEEDGEQKVVLTSELVRHYASLVFKKQEVRDTALFQVTRNADVFIEDDMDSYDADFRAAMEKMLKKRRRQQPVRLMVSGRTSPRLLAALTKNLKVAPDRVFVRKMPFDLSFGSGVKKTPDMKYPERRSQRGISLPKGEFLPYLRQRDILLAYPFQSMNGFVEFLYDAADDPEVISIRITLYRLSNNSKVAAALAYAADRGKDVLCLLELRARFDEQNNIDYSEVLENAGCQVIYGLPDRKVHSKLCLVTRKSGEGVEYFTQVGTGNYNETTSEFYTDLSVMTGDQTVGRDAAAAFEALALGQEPPEAESMWIAPKSYRSRVLQYLERETAKGENGRVFIKVNSMNDLTVMRALIRASQAGVKVELLIRGICCLRPGIPGYTDNITVHSIVGRHLEHSRIFVFGEGEDQKVYVGSGDLLNRNTVRRVEAFIACDKPETKEGVLHIVEALRADRERSWTMLPDGTYVKEQEELGTASQDQLYDYFGTRTVQPLEKAVPPTPEKKHGWLWRLFHRK